MAATIKYDLDNRRYVNGLRQMSNKTDAWSKFSQKATRAVAAGFGAMSAAIAVGVRQMAIMEDKLNRIQTFSGGTAKEIGILSKEMDKVAISTGTSAGTLGDLSERLINLGVNLKELPEQLQNAAALTRLYGGDAVQVGGDLLVHAQAWGLTTKEIENFTVAAASVSDTTLTQLLPELTKVNKVASLANSTFREMALIVGVGRSQFKGIEESATAFQQTFIQLDKAGSQFDNFIRKELGKGFKDLTLEMGSTTEALLELERLWGEERLLSLFKLSGAKVGVSSILQNSAKILSELQADVDTRLADHVAGLDRTMNSMQTILGGLREGWNAFTRALVAGQGGENIKNAMQELTKALTSDEIVSAMQNVAKAMTDLAPVLTSAVVPMANLATALLADTISTLAENKVPFSDRVTGGDGVSWLEGLGLVWAGSKGYQYGKGAVRGGKAVGESLYLRGLYGADRVGRLAGRTSGTAGAAFTGASIGFEIATGDSPEEAIYKAAESILQEQGLLRKDYKGTTAREYFASEEGQRRLNRYQTAMGMAPDFLERMAAGIGGFGSYGTTNPGRTDYRPISQVWAGPKDPWQQIFEAQQAGQKGLRDRFTGIDKAQRLMDYESIGEKAALDYLKTGQEEKFDELIKLMAEALQDGKASQEELAEIREFTGQTAENTDPEKKPDRIYELTTPVYVGR